MVYGSLDVYFHILVVDNTFCCLHQAAGPTGKNEEKIQVLTDKIDVLLQQVRTGTPTRIAKIKKTECQILVKIWANKLFYSVGVI